MKTKQYQFITCTWKILLLAVLIHEGQLNANGMQYRGSFHCESEGYHSDPINCQIYYRCVDWGNGMPLTKFQFECAPGTVFSHAKGDICVHPYESERTQCNESGNDLDSNDYQPDYSPSTAYPSNSWTTQSTEHHPASNEIYLPPMSSFTSTTIRPPSSSTVSNYPSRPSSISDNAAGCNADGFLADSSDCKKFIRCVDNGRGSYQSYEFTCGEGTVWDPAIEACNHHWAVQRSDCQVNHLPSESLSGNVNDENNKNSSVKPCQTESSPTAGAYPVAYPSSSQSPATVSTTATSIATTSHSSPVYLPSSESTLPPTPDATPPSFTSSPSDNNIGQGSPPTATSTCTAEGFFADPDSCTKFHRCVQSDNKLTKYEFECGEGTAWDQTLQTCNHYYAVPGCGKNDGDNSQTSRPVEENKTQSPVTTSEQESTTAVTDSPSSASTEENKTESSSVTPREEESTSTLSTSTAAKDENESKPTTAEASSTEESSSSVSTSSTPTSSEVSSESSVESTPMTSTTLAASSSTNSQQESTTTAVSQRPTGGSQCQEDGFFANPTDCRKFYRCVQGNNGYTKYNFDCAPGTAWDQTLLTCNYIDQVASCGTEANEIPSGSSSGEGDASTSKPASESTQKTTAKDEQSTESLSSSTGASTTTEGSSKTESTSGPAPTPSAGASNSSGDCSKKPSNNGIVCNEAGFYGNPTRCDKFYRCVDNGNGFNVYHFDCPPGTIFDPSISVCNYPESVYPARDCSSGGSSTESTSSTSTTTSTSESSASSESSATEVTEQTEGTTESSSSSSSEGTTSNEMETDATDTTEVTDSGATLETTTSGGSEEMTTIDSESTTKSDEASTTPAESESTPEITESPGEMTEATTTESQESTNEPEMTTPGKDVAPGMVTPCPIGNLTDEQIVLVCPTGFRRHPKYCNMFYQCSTEEDMKIRILVLGCPEGTIFDEENIKCSPEAESSKACDTEVASARFYRQLESTSVSPVRVSRESLCPGEGHYPYQEGCSNAFYKCRRDSRRDLQGYLYKCPKNFVYWSVSRRCERASRLPTCSKTNYEDELDSWASRWEIPIENNNLSARLLRI